MPFDLGSLRLSSGEGRRIDVPIALEPVAFGGQTYAPDVDGDIPVTLDIARTTGQGYSLRLRYSVGLDGPCMRCLEPAREEVVIDSREVDQPGGSGDMNSPYVEDDVLDVEGWAREALVLALPTQIVCREDCAGLCAECGANLNQAGPDHSHPKPPDPRFEKLSELRFD
ncbi:MAG: DUF177 domain-containing protein [Thermoleophilaceae bacterium]|nr:DUF177 domain-containing protein [Thermoleophilaceae bacterium]